LAIGQDNFDIPALIAKLRERRVSMVQSKPQFTLIYDTPNWLWANHHLSSPPPAISSNNQ
ncbi:MAG: hypothetical protein KDK65_05810, partial [Chlamydiia bacterium]|nr:hypothetical protein [Chlamydiia bacterium]